MSTQPLSKDQLKRGARAELARRELARRYFGDFCPYVYEGYPKARHLDLLHAHLQQVERYIDTSGEEGIGNLMINLPPRHWKSTTVSVLFPTWILGRHPDMRVILTSYNASLAYGFSRRARDHMQDTPFRNLFGDQRATDTPVMLSDDSRSVESWDIAGRRGGLAAAGVGGGLTGKGANLMIVDDPHKDRQDAESEVQRERIWEWWTSTVRTRLERGAAVIVIQTRWHLSDLSGKLLQQMEAEPTADQWVVLSLPAVAEEWAAGVEDERVRRALGDGYWLGQDALERAPGEVLWPEMFPLSALTPIKSSSRYDWDSLYQQRPQRREGALIRAYDIRPLRPDQVPPGLSWMRYWDLAVSARKSADWISGGRVAFGPDGRLYIGHVRRIPGPWADARGTMTEQMLQDGPSVRQGIETSGQQGGYYQEMARDTKLRGIPIEGVNPQVVGNKEVRAQIWASRIQDNLVYLVDDGTWDVDDFVSECLAFPNGAHDDQVDAVSGGVQMQGGWSGGLSDVPQDESVENPWGTQLGMQGAVTGWNVTEQERRR
jgi:predicted phage terminase large subunit-like protein